MDKFLAWLLVSKPSILDVTDDELPPETHRTWDNLDDAYDFDDEED
jgi:hypothetical protein